MGEENGVEGAGGEVPEYLSQDIESVLIDAASIERRVAELGARIAKDYAGKSPVLLGVLTGSFVFLADLCRKIECKHEVAFAKASSYVGTESSGKVELRGIEHLDITDRHVIVVEDIIDTGLTLRKLLDALHERNPASVSICSFLLKETDRRPSGLLPEAEYIAFNIADQFVVGYGLDCDQLYRHLPFVGLFKVKASKD